MKTTRELLFFFSDYKSIYSTDILKRAPGFPHKHQLSTFDHNIDIVFKFLIRNLFLLEAYKII